MVNVDKPHFWGRCILATPLHAPFVKLSHCAFGNWAMLEKYQRHDEEPNSIGEPIEPAAFLQLEAGERPATRLAHQGASLKAKAKSSMLGVE
jgi:hypothetical protein